MYRAPSIGTLGYIYLDNYSPGDNSKFIKAENVVFGRPASGSAQALEVFYAFFMRN